jgi:hypothetical protein
LNKISFLLLAYGNWQNDADVMHPFYQLPVANSQ